MVHIHCPHCSSRLEIDPGFVGGICRCFNCGTLMTVPKSAEQQVEQLQRQERPDRPDTPGMAADTGAEHYVTTSGRVINLDRRKLERVPVARRPRMGVRISVVSALILFMIFLVIGLVWLMNTVESQPTGSDDAVVGQQVTVQTLGYDPSANPYLLERGNLFGLPVKDSAIVVVSTGSRMREYLGPVKDMLVTNLRRLDETTRFQVVFATHEGPHALPETLTPRARINVESFDLSLNEISAAGRPKFPASAERALAAKPAELVLVLYNPLSTEDALKLEAMLKSTGVTCHVILLGPSSDLLQALAAGSEGRCIELGGGQLQYWHEQWRKNR